MNDQPQLIVHVGIDPRLMEIRFAGFRTSVRNRILLGSSLVVLILTLALFYVLWLLKRAQMVEAEAHMADQLAYLGTLASGLAHEIRNPLNAINLNLQMIEEEIDFGRTQLCRNRSSSRRGEAGNQAFGPFGNQLLVLCQAFRD